jgi:hypothetical protein
MCKDIKLCYANILILFGVRCSVVGLQRFDADPDLNFHVDPDPDPG